MPPKHKKQSAHPRDRRNENGLAAPGKQIKKGKPDGNANGHADNRPIRRSPIPANPPVAAPDASGAPSDPNISGIRGASQVPGMGQGHSTGLTAIELPRLSTASRDRDIDSPTFGSQNPLRPHSGFGNHDSEAPYEKVQTAGSSEANTTVITTWSILDTVAILMVLMQLPSSVLTLINAVFAFLTFGALPTGWSISSVASSSEWLQSHGGNPSILTMIFLDLVFLGLWCVAPFGRNLFLGFAQAVVAVSLGGCSNGQPGHISGLFTVVIVCCQHYLGTEYCRGPLKWVSWLFSLVTSRTVIGPVFFEDLLDLLRVTPDIDRSWPRALLELHIVTQGIIRVIRRAFVRQTTTRSGGKKHGADLRSETSTTPTDPIADGAQNTSTDGRQPGPSPAATREGKEKSVSSGKKRRKQATFVRSQQPFWAAIATTKVTVSREIEQSQASRDSFEAGSERQEQLGSASHHCVDDSVWVSDIYDTEIWFSALCFMPKDPEKGPAAVETPSEKEAFASGVSNAIVVRVNGAEWTSKSVVSGGLHEGKAVLTGKIFGLASLTNYRIEFLRAHDQALLHSVSLLTRPDASLDQAPLEEYLRPSSPTSTLKKSINAAEVNLADYRNRCKKTRKDHKSANNGLRKEVDIIDSRLSSCGGNDERQRQRQIQYRQNIKQAEEAYAIVVEEIEQLGDIPDADNKAAAASKQRWRHQEKAHKSARDELEQAKAERERQVAASKAETTQQQQKHDRLTARLNKLTLQRESLLAAQAQDSKDQKRRDQTRFSEMAASAEMERSYNANNARVEAQRHNQLEQIAHFEHQIMLLETALPPPPASYLADAYGLSQHSLARPLTTVPPPGFPGALPGYQHHSIGTPPIHSRRSSLIAKSRGRSSSMLSTVSAFTDDEIDGPMPHPQSQIHVQSGNPAAASAAAAAIAHATNGTGAQPAAVSAAAAAISHATNGMHAHHVSNGSRGSSGGSASRSSQAASGRPVSRTDTASPRPKLSPIGAGSSRYAGK